MLNYLNAFKSAAVCYSPVKPIRLFPLHRVQLWQPCSRGDACPQLRGTSGTVGPAKSLTSHLIPLSSTNFLAIQLSSLLGPLFSRLSTERFTESCEH